MSPKRTRAHTVLLLGFALGAGAAYAYVELGAWNLPTPWTFTAPRAGWARVVFAPGLLVARTCFHAFLKPVFSLRAAMWVAGGLGVFTMGIVGALAAWILARLRR